MTRESSTPSEGESGARTTSVKDRLDPECRICGATKDDPNGAIIPRLTRLGSLLDGTWICGDHAAVPDMEGDQ